MVKRAQLPNGQTIPLLKTLLSSYCENNCTYCPFRAQRDFPRASFSPDDFARLFISLYERQFVEGIFLSSSIFYGAVKSQDLLLDTASILRNRYSYRGYLHLKIMPGAEKAQVEQAMLVADRLSVNLETPTPQTLSVLAPRKDLQRDLIDPLLWMEEIRRTKPAYLNWKGSWPSSTTQYVVGAAGESDRDLLRRTSQLTKSAGISRAYFSSFNPIPNTPLEDLDPSPPLREIRLYQASYLIRDYGFSEQELIFSPDGNLSLDQDPKLNWASRHLSQDPLEVNTASREQLLKIPGIGITRAERILKLRRTQHFKSFSSLVKADLIAPRSAAFILVDGKSPARQLSLL